MTVNEIAVDCELRTMSGSECVPYSDFDNLFFFPKTRVLNASTKRYQYNDCTDSGMCSVIKRDSGANLWTGTLNKRSCNDPSLYGSSEVFNLSFHSYKNRVY
jgi:hypothetical protein